MKLKMRLLLIALFISVQTLFAQGFGEAEKINPNWKFVLHDVEDGEQVDLNDRRWQSIHLPHDWSVKQQLSPTLASCTGFARGHRLVP